MAVVSAMAAVGKATRWDLVLALLQDCFEVVRGEISVQGDEKAGKMPRILADFS